MQEDSYPNAHQSIQIFVVGEQVSIGNINQNVGSARKVKISFDTFVDIISQKYIYLENLPLYVVEDIWKMLINPYGTELQRDEVSLLKLAVRYCCFFKKGWKDPEERKTLDSNYYQRLVEEFLYKGSLTSKRRMLSKIIMDQTMSNLLGR